MQDTLSRLLTFYNNTPILHEWWLIPAIALLLGWALRGLLQVRGLRGELVALRGDVDAYRTTQTELEIAIASIKGQAEKASFFEERLDETTDMLREAEQQIAMLDSQLKSERSAHTIRVDEMRKHEAVMQTQFDTLAATALEKNSEKLLAAVSERFAKHKETADGDLSKRQVEINQLLQPIRDNLTKFELQAKEMEKTREGAYHSIRQQVASLTESQTRLGTETNRLVTALRAPKTRGNWGEFQLKQLFDMAGMSEGMHYDLEKSYNTDDGRRRPDAIVKLPGGKSIVIDAKTPMDAYLNAVEAEDAGEKRAALINHARQLKDQVKNLSQKGYRDHLPVSPDFVVLFVPGEAFYSAALDHDPGLFEYAINNNVLIASPTNMIALLKSVAYGWQQEKQTENAQAAVELARELYKRISTFGSHLEKLGKALNNSVTSYNSAIGSIERNVLTQARKFEGLGMTNAGDNLTQLDAVETDLRSLTAPELTKPAES